MFPRYLQYLLMDFCHTFATGASSHKDELNRFGGQRSMSRQRRPALDAAVEFRSLVIVQLPDRQHESTE